MIPKRMPLPVGLDVVGWDGKTYRIVEVYGRGRNRAVRLDRPPSNCRWPDIKMVKFRRLFRIEGLE